MNVEKASVGDLAARGVEVCRRCSGYQGSVWPDEVDRFRRQWMADARAFSKRITTAGGVSGLKDAVQTAAEVVDMVQRQFGLNSEEAVCMQGVLNAIMLPGVDWSCDQYEEKYVYIPPVSHEVFVVELVPAVRALCAQWGCVCEMEVKYERGDFRASRFVHEWAGTGMNLANSMLSRLLIGPGRTERDVSAMTGLLAEIVLCVHGLEARFGFGSQSISVLLHVLCALEALIIFVAKDGRDPRVRVVSEQMTSLSLHKDNANWDADAETLAREVVWMNRFRQRLIPEDLADLRAMQAEAGACFAQGRGHIKSVLDALDKLLLTYRT
jgi:hypothetical protein